MKLYKILCSAIPLLGFMCVSQAMACADYESIDPTELKSMRDVLVKEDADPIDRLTVFQLLMCSDQPAIRAYAIDVGKQTSDVILQAEVVAAALSELDQLDIKLVPADNLNDKARKYVERVKSSLSFIVRSRSRSGACVGLIKREVDLCPIGARASALGSTVEFSFDVNSRNLSGAFALATTGDMIGYIESHSPATGRIPAILRLFP
ncbi:MAG: hypothetical protein ABJQ71_22770 [Roseibium sp.]